MIKYCEKQKMRKRLGDYVLALGKDLKGKMKKEKEDEERRLTVCEILKEEWVAKGERHRLRNRMQEE